ncbi:hypothetical protein SAMN05421505_11678 [Sinosporangium album]|uniref:Uncharacterized protein n=1 Tax=Sinosporangium album TaxID=504805 RepID=A0A1G8CN10_9ACTN|nr:hypothetical protein [Sinosporangium album]SDH46911.1 hypothetical protein SAMN05421505_11678 [Sinosporangium album]
MAIPLGGDEPKGGEEECDECSSSRPGEDNRYRRWLGWLVRVGTGTTVLIQLYLAVREVWPEL